MRVSTDYSRIWSPSKYNNFIGIDEFILRKFIFIFSPEIYSRLAFSTSKHLTRI
jgi:hypothetical protein